MYNYLQMDNGIRVITERIPHFRSVSVGLWFRAGSVYEEPNESGLSHFIEHMLFKGTTNRSARQIAEEMDAVGGQMNAFTAKEYTSFYCKVMDDHLALALDLLSDMLLNSCFDEEELQKEKSVILEEIDMYEDSPEDVVHELLNRAYFGEHPLAAPILGNSEQLLEYRSMDLLDFKNRFYTTDNLVIAAAGNFQEEELFSMIQASFGKWSQRGSVPLTEQDHIHQKSILFTRKDIEQYHLSLSFPGIPTGHDDNYPLLLMNNLFGGSMSSRLFQRIREEKGLAYSVFSYPSNYLSAGMFSIYAGMKPKQNGEVLKLIMEEVNLLKEKGFTREEFQMAREQLKGNYILGSESTSSRMNTLGKARLLRERVLTSTQVIDKINEIQPEDVARIIQQVFQPDRICAALVGREDQTDLTHHIISRSM